jgi:NAD(P)-dependent dehydrogenase (short-subunit alcohol dehydrogenase family)
MDELKDKVCVVTGGGSGIGRALAHRFAAAGMRVALGDVEPGPLKSVVDELGGDGDRVLGVECDVRSVEDVERLRNVTLERFGTAHVVCLNAGVAPIAPLLETSPDAWRWVVDVNLMGVAYGVHSFGRLLADQRDGHIVCTASSAGLVDAPSLGAYCATKHAVVGLAASLRRELAESNVGVSVVCPGLVNTKIFESERNLPDGMADPTVDDATTKAYREMLTTGVSPDMIADFVHRAVINDQFFVIPNAEMDPLIEARIDLIRQGIAWRDADR